MDGCGPWLFMNLYYMAAVNSDYWLLVGVKIERHSYQVSRMLRATSESLRCLKEELTDFTLSPVDLPTPHTYNAVGGQKKACAGSFWWVVGKIKTLSGEPRSSN